MPSGVYPRTELHKLAISNAVKGLNTWSKGSTRSLITRQRIGLAQRGIKRSDRTIQRLRDNAKLRPNYKGGVSNNPVYVSWLKNKRHKLKREAVGSHSYEEWVQLKAKYSYTCPSCHRKEPDIKLTEDHIVSLSKDGSDFIENIQPLCASCNYKKHDKIILYPRE